MKYTKSILTSGAWIDKSKLSNGQRMKLVSETAPAPSNFKDEDGNVQMQDVAKARFEGIQDAVNVSLNKTTINGLIDAFGEDSKDWTNKTLTVSIEKGRYGGKASFSLYLVPQGYVLQDDENGYAKIVPMVGAGLLASKTSTTSTTLTMTGRVYENGEVPPSDYPQDTQDNGNVQY